MENIHIYSRDTFDIYVFITDEFDFDKICSLLRSGEISKFSCDENEEDILEDIKGFKNEAVEIKDFKFFRIVTVITYG